MNNGDRVMIVANAMINETKCSMGTLHRFIRAEQLDGYTGVLMETWEVWFDDTPWREGTYRCNMLVAEENETNPEGCYIPF